MSKRTLKDYLEDARKSNKENRLRTPNRNPLVAPQADLAKKVKALLNRYETKKLGDVGSLWNKYGAGHSIGDLLFGQSPELLDDISYGLNPLTSGGRIGRIPIPDKRLLDIPVPTLPTGGLGVIKKKGGNWLTSSVENILSQLKKGGAPGTLVDNVRRANLDEYVLRRDDAIDQWIDGPLTKYIKNRMATPSDEVRKLADQGILHYDPYHPDEYNLSLRSNVGFPEEGLAKTDLGRDWEYSTDTGVIPLTAGERRVRSQGHFDKGFPELSRVKDDEMIYQPLPSIGDQELGLSHLIDELLNATSPNSGLPMNLRMKPEGFKGLSMEEAVKKVHGINQFRAEQAKKINKRFAQAEGIPVYKDYGDGTRLLEYKLPEVDDLEVHKWLKEHGAISDLDTARPEVARQKLESWLKQEGDTMGHCVGGYCDEVISGRSRILSLRDKEGKSRATIELSPEQKINSPYLYLRNNYPDLTELIDNKYENYYNSIKSEKPNTVLSINARNRLKDEFASETPEWKEYLVRPLKFSINQIKGSGNRIPDPDVIPYLQDFVKSGDWLDVHDLQNVGLVKLNDGRYVTGEEYAKIYEQNGNRIP